MTVLRLARRVTPVLLVAPLITIPSSALDGYRTPPAAIMKILDEPAPADQAAVARWNGIPLGPQGGADVLIEGQRCRGQQQQRDRQDGDVPRHLATRRDR